MLLPSALSCPSRPSRRPHLQASLFTSPPASPPPQTASGHLYQTCLALQSMLSSPPPASPHASPLSQQFQEPQQSSRRQLPTPPMRNAALPSPIKLRLRSHTTAISSLHESALPQLSLQRNRVAKRSQPAPRGSNKRRRDDEDNEDEKENVEEATQSQPQLETNDESQGPSTPKRVRIAPETMPMGLERRDFEMLYDCHQYSSESTGYGPGFQRPEPRRRAGDAQSEEAEDDGVDWSNEEDRQLVELVLEKLKLSKSEWQDCARSLGRDSGSMQKRWKNLFEAGEIGIKTRGRRERSNTSATWR